MIEVYIVSQEREVFSGKATFVTAPATMGEIGITPGHSPLVSTLKQGEVEVHLEDGEKKQIFVSGGFIEVQPKIVTILSDASLLSDDVSQEDQLLAAQQQAQELLDKSKTDIDIAKAQSMLSNTTTKIELLTHLKDKLKKKGY